MYLVDSDWVIDALGDRGAARDVLEALSGQGLAISVLTYGEVYAGFVGQPNEEANIRAFRRFISRYEVLGLSEPIMLLYAQIWTSLRRQGRPLTDIDILIAATAMIQELTLITRNRKHFERVPGLRIYPHP